MDRQKIISSILLVVEVGLLCVVLAFSVLSRVNEDGGSSSENKSSEQISSGTEDIQDTTTEENWFGESEKRKVFSDAVEKKIASMTTEQKVAQLFLVSPEILTGVSPVTVSGNGTKTALEKYPVGGIVYSSINFTGVEQGNNLISGVQRYSDAIIGLPLFILIQEEASDYENHATIQLTEQDGKVMANSIWVCTYSNGLEVVAAIEDGANMVYALENFVEIYEAVLGAVNDGTITKVRLENAVGVVLTEKLQ